MKPIFIYILLILLPHVAEAQTHHNFGLESNGWQLKGDLVMPESSPRAVALLLHQAAGSRKEFDGFANLLAKAGIASLALDLRGHGESDNIERFDYLVKKNFYILENTDHDIARAIDALRAKAEFVHLPIIIISGSYSSEYAILASETAKLAEGYVFLSPGSLSENSMIKLEQNQIPALYVRAEVELSLFDELFLRIKTRAPSAAIWVLPGEGHASSLLTLDPELGEKIINWLKSLKIL